MPLSTKVGKTLITPDFARQIENNMSAGNFSSSDSNFSQTVTFPSFNESVESANQNEKKGKYTDVANLHFSTGKKAEFRAFFSAHEVSLVQGVENAVNYIIKEAKAGRLTVSRNGIEKVGEL